MQSRRKFRVQPLAGEPEKNVIRDGSLENLLKPGHSAANIGLDVAIQPPTNRLTHISHIFIFPRGKAFRVRNVKSIWSLKTVLGILPEAVLYFMRTA